VEPLRWPRLHPLVRLAIILYRDAEETGQRQDDHLVLHDSFHHNQRGNSSSFANRLNPLGYYTQDTARPLLKQNMNPSGDGSLTIPKCKNTCYRRAYTFARVQEGNQCWCSSFVEEEWAKNQTNCNMPCTGEKNTVCSRKGVFNVFKALANSNPATISSTTRSASTVKAAAASNSATQNRALFGMGF
jgi:hypothetical protein